jgi:ankyrin repeat protein
MNVSKFLLSLFYKANLAAFRAAILDNDTNRICRILDIEREHICKVLDNAGNTALLLAIQFAAPITVHVLLEQGAQSDQTNSITFQTPLNLLASTVHDENQCYETKKAVEMATMLLDHGAYVDKPSPYVYIDQHGKEQSIRETPLMTAVRTKNLSIAKLLVDRKANVNYCEKHSEYRP